MVDRPEDLPAAFAAAWNEHDMGAFGRLFADDADFVNVMAGWWRGRERIEAQHREAHATIFARSRLEVVETRARALAADVALVHARWRLTGHAATPYFGADPRTGILVFVARRDQEGWLIEAAQNTDAPPRG